MNPYFVVGIMFVYVFAGLVGKQLGITTDTIIIPNEAPSAPVSTGGIFDAIKSVLLPLVWVFNVLGSTFQLITFQAAIPPFASAFIILPIGVLMIIYIIKLVRGS